MCATRFRPRVASSADDAQLLSLGCQAQISVERRQLAVHIERKLQVHRVVDRQAVLVGQAYRFNEAGEASIRYFEAGVHQSIQATNDLVGGSAVSTQVAIGDLG
jgi:hypothetical protein